MNKIDLFVPGRLCLFGEHTDWAGEYRTTDDSVRTGRCIVAGTDQGIYGTAEAASTGFHISQILPDGSQSSMNSYSSEPELLRELAESAVFDSYAAGTAAVILKKHPNLGLRLRIHRRTLPMKKGLSSSAAVCVLTARAFNSIHTLSLSIEDEMEFAYRGELLTGSHCGRMDQACAYGVDPVLLTFDGDEMTVNPLLSGGPLHILIVDLQGRKNTRRILEELNYAFTGGNIQIRAALGCENHRITAEACDAIERGDAKTLGILMTEAQRIFDEMIAPACPAELRAPGLHEILASRIARSLTWGGKGVGSQGDGTAQFICKGPGEREELRTLLEAETDVECYFLTI